MTEEIQTGYIYLLREREFVRIKEDTYKVGKTCNNPRTRHNAYPKGSEILFLSIVPNCHILEDEIKEIFNTMFIPKKEYGNEYYQGDISEMIKMLNVLILKQITVSVSNDKIMKIKEKNKPITNCGNITTDTNEFFARQFINDELVLYTKEDIIEICKETNQIDKIENLKKVKLSELYDSFKIYYKYKTNTPLKVYDIKTFNKIFLSIIPSNVTYDKNNRVYKGILFKDQIKNIILP